MRTIFSRAFPSTSAGPGVRRVLVYYLFILNLKICDKNLSIFKKPSMTYNHFMQVSFLKIYHLIG